MNLCKYTRKKACDKEKVAELGLLGAALILCSYLGIILYQGFHTF